MRRTGPAFYVATNGGERIDLFMVDADGQETGYSETSPAEILLRRVELNFTALRQEVDSLWERYPLIGSDRAQTITELSRLADELRADTEMLRELDPLGYFYVTTRLAQYQPRLDMAMCSDDADLTEAGATLINIFEEPAWSQIPLRNMFEVAFDGMERATQRERYDLLTRTYASVNPPVVDRYYPTRRITESDSDIPLGNTRLEYRVESLDDLHHLLFSLYFSQKKQRIVRCECCWGYFIPPNTRPALYCDRVIDGKSCKQIGPGLRHAVELNRDAALGTYEALRRRMAVRRERYTNAAPDGRGNLIHMDFHTYDEWDRVAQAARKEYVDGKITAEEFLRRIDLCHDLESYDVDAPKFPSKSVWRMRVERDIRFDPYREYSDLMTLDLRAENPHWEITPSEMRVRTAQGDIRSLRDLQAHPETPNQEPLGIPEFGELDEGAQILRDAIWGYLHGQ